MRSTSHSHFSTSWSKLSAPQNILIYVKLLLAPWKIVAFLIGMATYLVASAVLFDFVGSRSYEFYHLVIFDQHPPTNWPILFFSVPVIIIAGILWSYDGTLSALFKEIRGFFRTSPDGGINPESSP